MAITNGYLTLAEYKEFLNISLDGDDPLIERAIESASRYVDDQTGRFFYKAEGEIRYLSPLDIDYLFLPDLLTATEIAIDENDERTYGLVWASSDYDLQPFNAPTLGTPYTSLTLKPRGRYTLIRGNSTVRVTGNWGWETPPTAIKQATFLIAHRLVKRKDAAFGMIGSPEFGQFQAITRQDPDAIQLLQPYRRLVAGVI